MNQDDAFDEAFEELQKRGTIAQFNVAQLHAISKAQQFVEETGTELGIYTLRKAFERGFIRGYMFAKEQKK